MCVCVCVCMCFFRGWMIFCGILMIDTKQKWGELGRETQGRASVGCTNYSTRRRRASRVCYGFSRPKQQRLQRLESPNEYVLITADAACGLGLRCQQFSTDYKS